MIPAAVGAVAPLVNFPDNCDVNLLPAGSKTAEQDLDLDTTPDDVIRVRFSKAQFEAIWAKEAAADEWDEVFPALAADADCEKPIIRVVRFDDSGTSFAFKDYLSTIDGGQGWLTTYVTGSNKTREWPGADFGKRTDCAGEPNGPGSEADATDHLTSGCSNGNGSLVSKLVATDGSVGYSDISTARSTARAWRSLRRQTTTTPTGPRSKTARTPSPSRPSSPTGSAPTVPKGANCQTTEFEHGLPASTFGDWSKATRSQPPKRLRHLHPDLRPRLRRQRRRLGRQPGRGGEGPHRQGLLGKHRLDPGPGSALPERLRAAARPASWRSPKPASPRSTGTRATAAVAAAETTAADNREPPVVTAAGGPAAEQRCSR